jgi:hypothetical protein
MLGLDTETAKGKAIIIANQNEWKRVDSFIDCVRFLLKPDIRLGWFYNLDYDFRAIVKGLGSRLCEQLYIHNEIVTEIDGHEITVEYIPAKFCSFKIGKRIIRIYDLWQYYNMSLDKAGEKYLGHTKIEVPHNILTHLEDYLEDKSIMSQFGIYCQNDAALCQELATYLLTSFDSCGIKTTKYFSTGYLAKRVLRQKHRCYALPIDIDRFVRPSFHGGRIEVVKRGRIDKLYLYDINSAYPAVISQLQDTCGATYTFTPEIQSDTFFLYGKIWLKGGRPFYPLPYQAKAKDLTIFPCFRGVDVCISSNEYACLQRHNLIDRLDITAIMNVHYSSDKRPFDFVEEFYQKRSEGDMQKLVYKLILNSLYGIFCEKSKSFRSVSEGERFRLHKQDVNRVMVAKLLDIFQAHPNYYLCECDNCVRAKMAMRCMRLKVVPIRGCVVTQSGTYVRGNRRGKFSNIINASLITSAVRCQIYDFAMRNPDSVIMFATDSVAMSEPLDIPASKKLGDISLQRIGVDGLVIGSGVYEFTDTNSNEVYTRFRGFDPKISLRKLLTNHFKASRIDIPQQQVVSLGTMVKSRDMTDHYMLNEFIDIIKVLDVNFDVKRLWPTLIPNGNFLLQNQQTSQPLTIGQG